MRLFKSYNTLRWVTILLVSVALPLYILFFFIDRMIRSHKDYFIEKSTQKLTTLHTLLSPYLQKPSDPELTNILNTWGKNNPDVEKIFIYADNGLLISQYHQPHPTHNTLPIQKKFPNSDQGLLTFILVIDQDPQDKQQNELTKQTFFVFISFFSLIFYLLFLIRQRQLESTLLFQQKQQLDQINLDLIKEISHKNQAHEIIQRDREEKQVISSILRLGLEPKTLADLLEEAIHLIMNIPWLALESKGTIFLVDEKTGDLILSAHKGQPHALLTACARIKPGTCLCGLAATNKKVIFADKLDDLHTITFPDIHDHGHYCAPILHKEQLVGVLNLYICAGHFRSEEDLAFLSIMCDNLAGIIVRKKMEETLEKMALYDALTGLLNRQSFKYRLRSLLTTCQFQEQKVAIIFIDLDRFKLVNDILGHDAGDELLIQATRRIQRFLRKNDFLARTGGDEFVAIALINDPMQAGQLAQRIIESLTEIFSLSQGEAHIGASLGIAIYPNDAQNEELLIKQADAAMYYAKEQQGNQYSFFDGNVQQRVIEKQRLTDLLRGAMERNELQLYFQPQVALTNGTMVGCEALLRWTVPNEGFIAPEKFIPIAEETGLIVAMGHWVLKTACQTAISWIQQGLPPIMICVNISSRQLRDQRFMSHIKEILQTTGFDPSHLELEITETATEGREESHVGRLLNQLSDMGIRLAIDDYGTGASSLKRLHNFPISTLKIDRSFIQGLPHSEESHTIVAATISLGIGLGLQVVAEGVETEAQRRVLTELKCQTMQGFLYEPPLPEEEFIRVLLENLVVQHMGERNSAGCVQ
ncbi:MAG: EAL domain-containing protein [Magnetococcus sp. DMHC-6]